MSKAKPVYLAIDQGGHSTRAIAFDGRGNEIARARVPIRTIKEGDHIEHDPIELLASARQVANEAGEKAAAQGLPVTHAGMATQRSSIACWNRKSGNVLSPVISWQDRRAADWLERFAAHEPDVHRLTGLVLSPHYGVSKLNWCAENLPAVVAARESNELAWGPMASYLVYGLLENRPIVADPANASRTLLWDYRDRDWSQTLLELFGIPGDALPECVLSRYEFGNIEINGRKVPFTVCTGDQSAAVYAFGTPQTDNVFVNIGTGAFVQRMIGNKPVSVPGLLSSVIFEDNEAATYVVEGTVNGAGSALSRVGAELGFSRDEIIAAAAGWLAKKDPPLFLNGISGLGAPYWIADFDSRFEGDGSASEKMAAVFESIVFLIAVNIDAMVEHSGPIKRLTVTGGISAQDGICQRLADVNGVIVERPDAREATARGLAYLLAGQPDDWALPEKVVFQPTDNRLLKERYRRWRAMMESEVERSQ